MPEDLKLDELKEQLHNYGDWLQQRSDVALSNVDGFADDDVFADAADHGQQRPSGGGRLLLAAGAVVLVAGAAILALANRGEPTGSVTAANGKDQTAEAATTEADVETGPDVEGPRSVLDVPGGRDASSDGAADGAAGPTDGNARGESSGGIDATAVAQEADADRAADSAASSEEPGEGAGENVDEASSTTATSAPNPNPNPNPNSTAATTLTTRPATSSTTGAQGGSVAPNPSPSQGSVTFFAPLHGDGVDINLGTTFRVSPVDGATSYTFIATQNGDEAFRLTVDQPTFVLPGQLNAFTSGWRLESGLMSVTVIASDAAGTELASQTIDVLLRAGGGIPRRGVGGEIMPTIPTIPER